MSVSRVKSLIALAAIGGIVTLGGVGCQPSQAPAPSQPPAESPANGGPEAAPPTEQPSAAEPATPEPAASSPETTTKPAPAPEQQCSASAFVLDTDPAGLNVRSGPGSDFDVIDTLPTDGPVEATIAASANGWLKLSVAWSMQKQELEQEGWVYAPLLGVTTRSSDADTVPLFSAPDPAASVSAEVPKFAEASLLSCSGDWLQVQTGDATGWLASENQCSSPVTTCP